MQTGKLKNLRCKGFYPRCKGSIGKAGETSGALRDYRTFTASASHGMPANRKPEILQHRTTPSAKQPTNQPKPKPKIKQDLSHELYLNSAGDKDQKAHSCSECQILFYRD